MSREIKMQAEEIQECIWMPVDEFLNADTVAEFNKWIVRAGMRSPGMHLTSVDGTALLRNASFLSRWTARYEPLLILPLTFWN